VHGKVVAELTFGFWRYILAGTYQATLWSPALRHAFPHLRTRDRAAVYGPVDNPVGGPLGTREAAATVPLP
jgi:hypothetical protein